ncbi:Copper resistance protein NlpE OS=Castellaniella defragrans OX=75697 GN=HNR28_001478 PE=4 SV=1 [Castellaniella defragrans]
MPSRPFSVTFAHVLGLGLLTLLSACAQQRQPGYYDVPRENTTSDALHRAQGQNGPTAPSQLQFGFGAQNQKPSSATDTGNTAAAAAGAGSTAAAPAAARNAVPQALTQTRTYLGTVPCPDTGVCSATRLTLTLAPDGQWRARNAVLGGKSPAQTAMGCWFLTGTDPTRIALQSGEQAYATLELTQPNVFRVTRLNGQVPLLESSLTRQADIDPIDELSSRPAQACPAH